MLCMLMCMECVVLWVAAMQLLLSMTGIGCLYAETVSSDRSVWYVGSFKLL